MKNVYTCRLARLISPVGSLWIYCKRFLRFLSDPDRLCCSPFWKSKTASHILAGALHVAPATEARRTARSTVSRSCEPSVSWLRYIECVLWNRNDNCIAFFQRFWCSNGKHISSGPCEFYDIWSRGMLLAFHFPELRGRRKRPYFFSSFLSPTCFDACYQLLRRLNFSPTWPTWRFWELSRCSISSKVRRGSRLLYKPLFLSPFISHIADIGRPKWRKNPTLWGATWKRV